jgi:hypothetical protein
MSEDNPDKKSNASSPFRRAGISRRGLLGSSSFIVLTHRPRAPATSILTIANFRGTAP